MDNAGGGPSEGGAGGLLARAASKGSPREPSTARVGEATTLGRASPARVGRAPEARSSAGTVAGASAAAADGDGSPHEEAGI
jgi:hypothetical protein